MIWQEKGYTLATFSALFNELYVQSLVHRIFASTSWKCVVSLYQYLRPSCYSESHAFYHPPEACTIELQTDNIWVGSWTLWGVRFYRNWQGRVYHGQSQEAHKLWRCNKKQCRAKWKLKLPCRFQSRHKLYCQVISTRTDQKLRLLVWQLPVYLLWRNSWSMNVYCTRTASCEDKPGYL